MSGKEKRTTKGLWRKCPGCLCVPNRVYTILTVGQVYLRVAKYSTLNGTWAYVQIHYLQVNMPTMNHTVSRSTHHHPSSHCNFGHLSAVKSLKSMAAYISMTHFYKCVCCRPTENYIIVNSIFSVFCICMYVCIYIFPAPHWGTEASQHHDVITTRLSD